ncbi:MAG: AtpZ/AtpI family protein [Pseudomonadota bacterium]
MATEPDKEQLQALNDRIAALKKTQAPQAREDEHYSQAHLGWRMVIELVAGILIGFGIGYGLDWVFGTLPLFLVLFILLGLAAGIKTMMRTASEIQDDQVAHAARTRKDATPAVGKKKDE